MARHTLTRSIFVDSSRLAVGTIRNDDLSFTPESTAIPSALLADPEASALLRSLTLYRSGSIFETNPPGLIALRTSVPGDSPSTPGPDLSDAWERSPVALTIRIGDVERTFPGPLAAGSTAGPDDTVPDAEPYNWFRLSQIADIEALAVAAEAAEAVDSGSTAMLTLDDGAVELAADFGFVIGGAASLTLTEPAAVELAADFGFVIGGAATLNLTEPAALEIAADFALAGAGSASLTESTPAITTADIDLSGYGDPILAALIEITTPEAAPTTDSPGGGDLAGGTAGPILLLQGSLALADDLVVSEIERRSNDVAGERIQFRHAGDGDWTTYWSPDDVGQQYPAAKLLVRTSRDPRTLSYYVVGTGRTHNNWRLDDPALASVTNALVAGDLMAFAFAEPGAVDLSADYGFVIGGTATLNLTEPGALEIAADYGFSAGGSVSLAQEELATWTVPLNAPESVTTTRIQWRRDSGSAAISDTPINPDLVADGGLAYLTNAVISASATTTLVEIFTADRNRGGTQFNDPLNSGASAGPLLTEAWEADSAAVTFTAGGQSITLPGPEAPGWSTSDMTEPYAWGGFRADTTPLIVDWITAFRALSAEAQAAATITLASVAPVALAADYALAGAGTATLNLTEPVDLAADFGFSGAGAATLNLTEPVDLAADYGFSAGGAATLTLTEPGAVDLSADYGFSAGGSVSLTLAEPGAVDLSADYGFSAGGSVSLTLTEPAAVELAADYALAGAGNATLSVSPTGDLAADYALAAGGTVRLTLVHRETPTPVSIAATPGPDHIDISWELPDAARVYTYEVSLDAGATWLLTGLATSYRYTGLEPGEYRVAVRARTPIGPGQSSSIARVAISATRITATTALLIGQYRDAANLQAVIDIGIAAFRERIELPHQRLRAMARIETAEGVWLDRLGRRLGIRRPYVSEAGIGDDHRFGFDDAGIGFDQGPFRGLAVNDAVFPLPDILFRRMITARAVLVLGDGTISTLRRGVAAIDPTAVVTDNHDMTITVATHLRWQIELADRIGALPRTAGVRLRVRDRGRFGFDDAGVGYDQGPFA